MVRSSRDTKLKQLRALANEPAARAALALELATSEKRLDILLPALKILAAQPEQEYRSVLIERYGYFDADGVKRDQGCHTRSTILDALRPIALQDDVGLLERAALTYEFLPPHRSEVAAGLRAAGLMCLFEIDHELATWHAVRLLQDPYTAPMSGEPALTAVRVLASCGKVLPLYQLACQAGDHIPDVVAECLRNLTQLPPPLLPSLVERHLASEDGIVLVGLFDLLLVHESWEEHRATIRDFLGATRSADLFHYLVMAIIASRKPQLIDDLVRMAAVECSPPKMQSLVHGFELIEAEPGIQALLEKLRRRMPASRRP